jgi:ABC-2 type transport system ATP-binding protein
LLCSLWKDEIQEKWRIVKSREDFITGENKHLFRGWRKSQYGFEALTSDMASVRRIVSSDTMIEKPTLEDLMFFMHKGDNHG